MAKAKAKAKAGGVSYDVHPAVGMTADWHAKLEKATGKSLTRWAAILKKDGPQGHKAARDWLKAEHGMSSRDAWLVADEAAGKSTWTGDPKAYLRDAPGYVEEQYVGKKAALRPLFDALLALGKSMGEDVKVCPCRTMVPLYRKYVFAEIRPATNSRVDLALALGDRKPSRRVPAIKGAAANRVRHRIAIESLDDIDDEVRALLREAWEKGDEQQEKAAPVDDVPPVLEAMLAKTAKARKTWESMTAKMRRDWCVFVTDAKKEETRLKRVDRARERLSAGKKALY